MARFFLAILATLALAISPIAVTAAPMSCGMHASGALDMPDGTSSQGADAPVSPCCDKALKACAAICLSICAVAVLPAVSSVAALAADMTLEPTTEPPVRAYRPPGPDHPPKLPD